MLKLQEDELKEKIAALSKEREDVLTGANQRISFLVGQIEALEWVLNGCPNGEVTGEQPEKLQE